MKTRQKVTSQPAPVSSCTGPPPDDPVISWQEAAPGLRRGSSHWSLWNFCVPAGRRESLPVSRKLGSREERVSLRPDLSCSKKGLSDGPVLQEARPTGLECGGGLEERTIFRREGRVKGTPGHKGLLAAEVCAYPWHSLFLEPRTGALEQGRRSQDSSWGRQQRSQGRREASRGQYPSPTCLP